MSRIPWLWNVLSQYWLEIETSFCFFLACENIRFSSLFTEEKRMFSQASFFLAPWARQRSPKIIVRDNFGTKKTNLLLWWWRYTHTLNRFSRSGISTFRHWSQGLANETWNPKCESRHSPFLARNAIWNPTKDFWKVYLNTHRITPYHVSSGGQESNAVFRLERATEVLELTYLGKYFACVNANWYAGKHHSRQ